MYNYKLEMQMVKSEYFLIISDFFSCVLQEDQCNCFLVLDMPVLWEYTFRPICIWNLV